MPIVAYFVNGCLAASSDVGGHGGYHCPDLVRGHCGARFLALIWIILRFLPAQDGLEDRPHTVLLEGEDQTVAMVAALRVGIVGGQGFGSYSVQPSVQAFPVLPGRLPHVQPKE